MARSKKRSDGGSAGRQPKAASRKARPAAATAEVEVVSESNLCGIEGILGILTFLALVTAIVMLDKFLAASGGTPMFS